MNTTNSHPTCAVSGCGQPIANPKGKRPYCPNHRYRFERYGNPEEPERPHGKVVAVPLAPCAVSGCPNVRRRRTGNRPWCEAHYRRWREYGDPVEPSHSKQRQPCSVEGCDLIAARKAMCVKHFARFEKYGDTETVRRKPTNVWRIARAGYIHVKAPAHPNAMANGWVPEHRLVMSRLLGRPLLPDENVHHKNGNRTDNTPENLELWVSCQPRGQRPEDLVPWAREILRRYGSLVGSADECTTTSRPCG